MSDEIEGVRTETRHTSGGPDAVLLRRCALALNVTILVFSVYVVWVKLAGTGDDPIPREIPLHPLTRGGVGGAVGAGPGDAAPDGVGAPLAGSRPGDGTRGGATPAEPAPRVAVAADHDPPPRVAAGPVDPPRVALVPVVEPQLPVAVPEPPVRPEPEPEGEPGSEPDAATGSAPWRTPPALDAETRQRVLDAERRVGELGVQLEVVCNKAGAYPSSARDFGQHRGVEALFAALATHGRSAGLDVGDADGDGRMEVLDPWGRPLVYFSHDDYGSKQAWQSAGTAAVHVTSVRSRSRGVPQAAGRFQLWSVGPNGRNDAGGGDDITSWILRD